ncbi:MAG: acetate kinase, partial [Clostridia bacterium]|nr:acetate kinase [Clostridia bacterium]
MKILVINCGSSSLKFQLIDMADESVLAKGLCERIGFGGRVKYNGNGVKKTLDIKLPDHVAAFNQVKKLLTLGETKVCDPEDISAIGHRVVQGGDLYNKSMLIDSQVEQGIKDLAPLAPLHNPAHIQGIDAARAAFGPTVPQVAVFDNAFHSTMPQKVYIYPLPYEIYETYKVRKYGFHGTSHRYVSEKLHQMHPEYRKVITCHLGNGSSLAAIKDGQVIDTTMGLTPLGGFMMGTRSGNIDPAIIPFLQKQAGYSPDEIDELLNKKSGFLGVSGVSSDIRDVEEAAMHGNLRAQLAIDIFCYQIAKLIGSFTVALHGLDAIVFTAGIGENDDLIR